MRERSLQASRLTSCSCHSAVQLCWVSGTISLRAVLLSPKHFAPCGASSMPYCHLPQNCGVCFCILQRTGIVHIKVHWMPYRWPYSYLLGVEVTVTLHPPQPPLLCHKQLALSSVPSRTLEFLPASGTGQRKPRLSTFFAQGTVWDRMRNWR